MIDQGPSQPDDAAEAGRGGTPVDEPVETSVDERPVREEQVETPVETTEPPPTATGPAAGADTSQETEGLEHPPLEALLEAVLLVADHPVPALVLAQVVERPTEQVETALGALAHRWSSEGRGIDLRQAAGGWRLYSREECAPWVERFVLDGQQSRLSQAALETLAVVAYRQPVTRARVSAVRGVNVDGVIRTLTGRGLLTEAGQDPDTGGTLYETTPLLLEKLGLDSLAQLPSLAPLLPELGELEQDSMST